MQMNNDDRYACYVYEYKRYILVRVTAVWPFPFALLRCSSFQIIFCRWNKSLFKNEYLGFAAFVCRFGMEPELCTTRRPIVRLRDLHPLDCEGRGGPQAGIFLFKCNYSVWRVVVFVMVMMVVGGGWCILCIKNMCMMSKSSPKIKDNQIRWKIQSEDKR